MKTYYFIILFCLTASVYAQDKDCQTVKQTNITNINNIPGVASALAQAQIHSDWHTQRLQYGIGYGDYHGSTAYAFGVSKKFCENCPLLSVTVSRENDMNSVGAGLNNRF